MFLLDIQFSITDIVVLQIMAIVLGVIIHFVMVNRKNLHKMIKENEERNSVTSSVGRYATIFAEEEKRSLAQKKKSFSLDHLSSFGTKKKEYEAHRGTPDAITHLKQSMQQQQKMVEQLMRRVDKWEGDSPKEADPDALEAVEIKLEEKELELQRLKQQYNNAQKIAGRVDEVYREFEALQQKLQAQEAQVKEASNIANELDDLKGSYLQLKKELQRKHEKLEEVASENRILHHQLAETEDKLGEANLQRQQLIKKVQFLENINSELQQMNDANKKLQTELRRIGELESMLSMVSDERDHLLKRSS